MSILTPEEIRKAYWKGRDEADSPVDEGAGWKGIAKTQDAETRKALEEEYHPSIQAQKLQVELAVKAERKEIKRELEALAAEAIDISDWSFVQQYIRELGKSTGKVRG